MKHGQVSSDHVQQQPSETGNPELEQLLIGLCLMGVCSVVRDCHFGTDIRNVELSEQF